MKKKGRICGTIGLILSLALAGGTVVYGAMFDKNAVGKAEKPFGAATGNVFDGWFKGEGFNETKELVDATEGVFNGTDKDGKYKSYSLFVRQTGTLAGKGKAVNDLEEMSIFTDENYTYIKTTVRITEGRSVNIQASEHVLAKNTQKWYMRTNSYSALETAQDVSLLDQAKWKEGDEPGIVFTSLKKGFASVSDTNRVYIDVTGTYYFKDTANLEGYPAGAEAEVRFTVGLNPTVYQQHYIPETEIDGVKVSRRADVVWAYSNLNNTKVTLPESLKEVLK